MNTAIWIIAIVEVIRALQNTLQLIMVSKESKNLQFKKATDAFIESLQKTDEEYIRNLFDSKRG